MSNHLSLPLAAVAVLFSTSVLAQTQRAPAGGASAQIMQQYQQLSAERVALQTENARLKKEAEDNGHLLEGLRKERDLLKKGNSTGGAELQAARSGQQTAEAALAKNRQSLDELVARFRETAAALKTAETDRARLQQEASTNGRALDACAVSNSGLYDVNREVVDRWEHEGFLTSLGRSEPFLRLKRTEIENLADGYRERAAQLKLKTTSSPPPTK